MAKNQKKYTQEFKQQMTDLYNTGNYSYPQLSSEYGVAKSTILGWVKDLSKVTISDTETISVKDYKALQKHLNLYTVKQMCKALKFPRSTYYKTLLSEASQRQKEYEAFSQKVLYH